MYPLVIKKRYYFHLIAPLYGVGYYLNNTLAHILYGQSLPIRMVADWPVDLAKYNVWATAPRLIQHPIIDTNNSTLEHNRTRLKKRFGPYGFKAWIKYKLIKPICINISHTIDGA